MRTPQSVTIDGWRYTVTPLPAGAGLALVARVAKLLGPSLAALLRGASGDALGAALTALVDRVSPVELVEIAKEITAGTKAVQPGGKEAAELSVIFDDHFGGDYLRLLDVVKFAAEVNFGPFVAGLRARAAVRADAAAG